ncbi:MAG: hypothetical protein HC876_16800, partial [Chloroflexaceae bacterium]|nr:hypothetical protein [Chloroflexaceae bacterium]
MNARVRLFLSQFVVLVLLGALLAACGSAAPQPAAPAAEEAPAEEAAEERPCRRRSPG